MWQDPVIAFTVTVFTLSVIPMVIAKTEVPLSTSSIMTIGAATLTVCYFTMDAWFSVGAEVVATVLWGIILYRGLKAWYFRRKLKKFVIDNFKGADRGRTIVLPSD